MSTTRHQRISDALIQTFAPSQLLIHDDSQQHRGGTGRESHYTVTVVSDKFIALTRIQRHRWVMQVLQPEFEQGLHALCLKPLTPDEWSRTPQPHQAPPCQHS